jgi:hypothetical protein
MVVHCSITTRTGACPCWSQELLTLLYALAKLGHSPAPSWLDAAFAALGTAAEEGRLGARELSTCLWAAAVLGHWPRVPFLARWMAASAAQMPHASAYDVSQSLWAMAVLLRPLVSDGGGGSGAEGGGGARTCARGWPARREGPPLALTLGFGRSAVERPEARPRGDDGGGVGGGAAAGEGEEGEGGLEGPRVRLRRLQRLWAAAALRACRSTLVPGRYQPQVGSSPAKLRVHATKNERSRYD